MMKIVKDNFNAKAIQDMTYKTIKIEITILNENMKAIFRKNKICS